MNKLLILPCTSEKLSGGIYLDKINDYFNNDSVLIKARTLRSNYYLNILSSNLKYKILLKFCINFFLIFNNFGT